jgi:hypothetical protein
MTAKLSRRLTSKCQVGARQVPSRCRAGAEAASSQDEAMPSSPGDARAAERAHTGGAKSSRPRRDRSADLDPVNTERMRLRSGG